MKTKIVYQCDPAGYFIGETYADESPLEPGVFHIPSGAVEVEPPVLQDGERAVFADGAWTVEQPAPAPEPEPESPPTVEEILALRRSAYRTESDPLKIEAEYDAILAGAEPDYTEWLAKVAEIKERFPLPEQ